MWGAATAKARLPIVDSLMGDRLPRGGWHCWNGVFVDQANRRHGSADRGNVVHRHAKPCTPEQPACTEFVQEVTTSAD